MSTTTIPSQPEQLAGDDAAAAATARRHWRPALWHVAVLVIAIVAGVSITLTTRWGAGLSPDSVTYLRMAHLFDRGGGVFRPVEGRALATSHYPPMYPATLSTLNVQPIRLKHTARWLNVALVMINVSLVAVLAYRATGRRSAAVATCAVAACSLAFIEPHAWVWTEPLFLAWAMGALLQLSTAIARPESTRWLLAAALATAAAATTRYAGLSLIGACTIAIVLLRRDGWRRRFVDAFGFALIAASPVVLWMVRNAAVFETPTNRQARWLGFDANDLDHLSRTLNAWFLPLQRGLDLRRAVLLAKPLAVALVVTSILAFIYLWWAKRSNPNRTMLPADADPAAVALRRLLALFAVCYFALVALTIFFLDSSTPFDTRILSPVQVAVLVGVAVFASRVAAAGRIGMVAVSVGLAMTIAVNIYATQAWARTCHRRGLGFAQKQWYTSPVLGHVSRLPPETRIYTNSPELIEAHLYRHSFILPRPYNVSTRSAGNYEEGMRRIAESLRTSDAVVVWFNRVPRNQQYESPREIIKKLNLTRVARSKDGALYRSAAAATQPATRPSPAPEIPPQEEVLTDDPERNGSGAR